MSMRGLKVLEDTKDSYLLSSCIYKSKNDPISYETYPDLEKKPHYVALKPRNALY